MTNELTLIEDDQDDAERVYGEADVHASRLAITRRLLAMLAITAVALPAAWTYDRRSDDAEELAVAPVTTIPTSEPSATTVAPVAVIPPITIASASGPTPSVAEEPSTGDEGSAGVDVDVASLPEIQTAADLARVEGRAMPEPSLDDLPEITAPGPAESPDDEQAATTTAAPAPPPPPADDGSEAERAPETTAPPAPETAPPAPPVTAAPGPPPPPVTEAPAPPSGRDPSSYSEAEIQQMIREMWPADQVDMALKVADRESGYLWNAENFCCVGIFQIHYEANQRLVQGLGFQRDDLYNPPSNIQIAFALWQASGWRPWSQTAY